MKGYKSISVLSSYIEGFKAKGNELEIDLDFKWLDPSKGVKFCLMLYPQNVSDIEILYVVKEVYETYEA